MAHLIFRKTWRLCGLVFPLIYILTGSRETTLFYIALALGFFLLIEIFRFLNAGFNGWLFERFRLVLKEKERRRILATTTFLVSILLVAIFFRKEVAIYSISFLIFGDIASALIGKNFGRIKIKDKTLEGGIAFFITCLFTAAALNLIKVDLPLLVVLIGALTATVVELLPLPLDDNFTIGLTCGIVMEIILKVYKQI
jgi:dolichol kinase